MDQPDRASSLSLVLWVELRPGRAAASSSSRASLAAAIRHRLQAWASTASRCCSCCCRPLLTPICILASWEAIQTRVREYMLAFLILETMMVGMFCALDFVVFYMFFEGVLIPMYLIIGVWGGPRRVYAAVKFFLYTLTGSVLMLLALLAMWFAGRHHRHPDADAHAVPGRRCRPGCSSPSSPRSR